MSLSDQELTDRVISIITREQKLAPGRVTADSTFEELGVDSLDGVNLLFAFEQEFDLNIPEHLAQQMRDVRQVVAGLKTLLAKRESQDAGSESQVSGLKSQVEPESQVPSPKSQVPEE